MADDVESKFWAMMKKAMAAFGSDSPVHDPSDKPIQVPLTEKGLSVIASALRPEELNGREILCIASPASGPKYILGAKADEHCCVCKQPCWVAPSSAELVGKAAFVCSSCAAERLKKVLEANGR